MRPGSWGISAWSVERRHATGVRRITAVAVALGVVAWAVLPVLWFPLDSQTGSTTCRMACADTPDCCCKPATAQQPTNDRASGTELSTPATTESCPRDCATLTAVPGTSTARSASGVHRLGSPGVERTAHTIDTHAAVQQGLFDVAQPRGPPTQDRNGFRLARVSPNTPGACASCLAEFPQKTRAGSGSSESGYTPARDPIHPSSCRFEPRDFTQSTRLASRRGQGPVGVDAHQYGGNS